MKIRTFETENFAGIKNRKVNFTEGINVLFGPNEAGKSTIIDGIFHTIFTPAKLHKSSDRDFYEKYFSPDSDTINSRVEFEKDNHVYILEKQWSKSKDFSERLILDDGSIVTDSKKINNILSDIFSFGSATYKVLNFSSQADSEKILMNLDTNAVRNDISNHINKTVMELDGISLEKFEENINSKIDSLIGRWDVENLRPMNNRGIDNPYEKGVGKILASYYEKEELKRNISYAMEKEKAFENSSVKLKEVEEKLAKNQKEKAKLDIISEDIRKRESLELNIKKIESDLEDLKNAIMELPKLLSQKTNLEIHGQSLNEKRIELENRIEYIEKSKKLKELENHIEAYNSSKEKYLEIEENLKKLDNISETDLRLLQKSNNEIYKLENQLKADGLIADLKILDESKTEEIEIFNGLGEKMTGEFKGSYLLLKIPDVLEFSVGISGLDFEQISQELIHEKTKRDKILKKTQCENEAKLRDKLKDKNNLEKLRDQLIYETNSVLNGRKYEDLIKEFESLSEYTESYNEKETKDDLKLLLVELDEKRTEFIKVDLEYKKLIEKYGSNDEIFEHISKLSVEKSKLDDKLNNLAELPEDFDTTDDFFRKKEKLDRDNQDLNKEYFEINKIYNENLRDLPQTTVEDMSIDYKEAEMKFNKLLKNYKNLSSIREIFYETKEEMLDNPTGDIEECIGNYLNKITQGSISINSLDEEISLCGTTSRDLRQMHLSKGSKDAVSLAFRLALVENMFEEGSFIAFDDVLNDLDEDRKLQAVDIIKEFSKNNQVIFASCEPTIKKLLEGNLTEIG